MSKPLPGQPLGIENPVDTLKKLYTLTYIYRNATMKTTILYNPDTMESLEELVRAAKELCVKRGWKFTWLEPAIIFLGGNE